MTENQIHANDPNSGNSPRMRGARFSRRAFLACATGGAALATGYLTYSRYNEQGMRASIFLGKAEQYGSDLTQIIGDGLASLGFTSEGIRGKTILLKPNLVEPNQRASHVNTHPEVVRAAAQTFLRLGANEVLIAEGQGHIRDSDFALEQSGFATMLAEEKLSFVDLNLDDVEAVPNSLGRTGLDRLWLPRTLVQRADLIVSMPKLKTHHLAGITVSMKNLFGVMPSACYGWPKNLLHQVGIPQSIVDITATVKPHLAIVDGIVGMEGDGPIMGTPRPTGILIMGRNLPAVDATAARIMGIEPALIPYLAWSSGTLGPIKESHISQRGELIANHSSPFTHIDHPEIRELVNSYKPLSNL